MPQEHKKRARLKQQSDAVKAWPDIFEDIDASRAIECQHGDRIATAHIKQFESATEEMVTKIWGTDASTTDIVNNWDNFILAKLLDVTCAAGSSRVESQVNGSKSALEVAELCETCLRNTANLFAKTLRVSRISNESVGTTPITSRAGSPVSGDRHSSSARECQRRLSRPLRIWALDTLDLRIYVTSAYIGLLRSLPLSICQDTPSTYTSLYLKFHPSESANSVAAKDGDRHLSVYSLVLASDSQNLLNTENAGGSSIESEVLSFEVLKRIMPYWELSTMEMSTTYASCGPITDYVARSYISPQQEISVSVTRIFGWSQNMKISKGALTPLLIRKLVGLRSATSRILPTRQRGMVLFIWVPDGTVEKNVSRVWAKLRKEDAASQSEAQDKTRHRSMYGVSYEQGVTQNVIVFVAVCEKASWMDLTGWRRVFGKVDCLENQYIGKSSIEEESAHEVRTATPGTPLTPLTSVMDRRSQKRRNCRRRKDANTKNTYTDHASVSGTGALHDVTDVGQASITSSDSISHGVSSNV